MAQSGEKEITNQLCWDRGTLVLPNANNVEAIQELPGVVWDPRTSIHRAPAWRYSDITMAAATQNLPILNKVFPNQRPPKKGPPPPLRHYQAAAVAAWKAAKNQGILVLPTGAGKTHTAAACMSTQGTRTIILVPTLVLLDQWCHALSLSLNPNRLSLTVHH